MAITAQDTKLKPGYKQTEVGVIPEDWEVRRLGEIATYKNGKSYERHISDNGEYFLITLDSISIDGKLKSDHKKINFLDNSLSQNDLVMILSDVAHGNFLGLTDVIPENNRYVLNQRVGALKNLKGANPKFLSNFINIHQVYFKTTGQGSSQQNLTKDDILHFVVLVPPLPEQQAIAVALSDVDALITSMDQLIAKKRDIKQATMQQLLTGKTRLPGFSGEWEVKKVKKLEEIGEKFVNGGTPSTQKPEYWQGNIPWITGADVINQKISDIRRFITSEAVKSSSTNIVERGNLLLVTRTGVGKLAVAPFDVAISQDITGIYVKKRQALVEYLFHFFNYNSESLKSLNQGTSIAGITRETLLSTNVYLPSFLEQKAIATVLTDMDAEIAALEQKRDKIRALKQGMMQELLTGKTRLI